ncbi:uncharacterized protein HMPREF1541_00740 [Cyphellophora europaea CBS 101466]|uniref:Uncharacterized protein n=1 Tax=Cyphellophora europaea (strain CBS 101466) TaxID=1220924 RepID=W2SD55_CYPE1|nr:uncharacterized protein HMPREF1541_00740 [Cyphellophora europaea CBS 101466]ETN46555.1 hypothetical protein HMPREF1541_00740 [Cyphellophora europaea CBS 101466]
METSVNPGVTPCRSPGHLLSILVSIMKIPRTTTCAHVHSEVMDGCAWSVRTSRITKL